MGPPLWVFRFQRELRPRCIGGAHEFFDLFSIQARGEGLSDRAAETLAQNVRAIGVGDTRALLSHEHPRPTSSRHSKTDLVRKLLARDHGGPRIHVKLPTCPIALGHSFTEPELQNAAPQEPP